MPQTVQQIIVPTAPAPHSPHWTAYASSVTVPFIAAVAAWIAFRQFRIAARQSEISLKQSEISLQQAETAKNKLKLDLFEKRMAIYEVVQETIRKAANGGKLDQEDQIKFIVGTRSAKWLLGEEVYEYIDKTLWHKLIDLDLHNSMSEGSRGDPERTKHIHARADTIKWLVKQFSEFDNLCKEYLSLKH